MNPGVQPRSRAMVIRLVGSVNFTANSSPTPALFVATNAIVASSVITADAIGPVCWYSTLTFVAPNGGIHCTIRSGRPAPAAPRPAPAAPPRAPPAAPAAPAAPESPRAESLAM